MHFTGDICIFYFLVFVDFHKAFDTFIHPGIRYKLIRNGINGLFYRIICHMYSSSMVSIKIGDKLTEPFTSSLGVRQVDVLSPNIFKLFLNDFSDIIENSNNSVYCILKRQENFLSALCRRFNSDIRL